jgi:hypothetical protein
VLSVTARRSGRCARCRRATSPPPSPTSVSHPPRSICRTGGYQVLVRVGRMPMVTG